MTQARNRPSDQTRLDAALERFAAEGFSRLEPPLLQPAGVLLDRLGEDFRGKLYLTSDGEAELCLRPEYTIPVCLEYLSIFEPGQPAALAYGGQIFRCGEGETLQTGLESFGRDDREAADAEILGVALDAAADAGAAPLTIHLGDAGLVKTFLDRLDLPAAWRRRFEIGHGRGEPLLKILNAPPRKDNGVGSGVIAALEKAESGDARKLVEDLLSIAGISTVGGRAASEIAERFLEQASLESGAGVDQEKRALLEAFFAVGGTPDATSAQLRALAREAKLDLGFTLDSFDTRSSFIAARGLALDQMSFSTSFARRLDYYSGFVFEARLANRPDAAPVIAGGRYDRLLRTLGAARDVPAVGAAIWINRLSGESQ